VAAAFRALPPGKAPGLDDSVGAELRLWPAAAAAGAAALLRAVERLGRWPSGLARSEVALLPNLVIPAVRFLSSWCLSFSVVYCRASGAW